MPDKKPFKVLSPIQHDGKTYTIGSMIELEPEQALSLIKSKVVAGDVPVVKTSRELELEAMVADLKLDLETASKGVEEMAKENAALKERNSELKAALEPKKAAKK
jgi:hypothetical protein